MRRNGIYINRKSKSKMNVRFKTFFLTMLLYIFLSVITLSILVPLAYYKYCSLIYNNTEIDGKKTVFMGTIKEAYRIYITGIVYIFILVFIYLNIVSLVNYLIETGSYIIPEAIRYLFTTKVGALINSAPSLIAIFFIVSRFFKWKLSNIYFLSRANDKLLMPQTKLLVNLWKMLLFSAIPKLVHLITASITKPITLFCKTKYNYERLLVNNKSFRFLSMKHIFFAFLKLFPLYLLEIGSFGIASPISWYFSNQYAITNLHFRRNLNSAPKEVIEEIKKEDLA